VNGHAGSAVTAALTVAFSVSAASALQVRVSCPRLNQAQAEELRARARLTLHAQRRTAPVRLIRVECDRERAFLVWLGQEQATLPIDETHGLVEGALDALSRQLQRQLPSPPLARETLTVGEPRDEQPRQHPSGALRTDDSRPLAQTGGVGFALSLEPRVGSVAVGPELDLGIGYRAIAGGISQALRLDAWDRTLLSDSRLLLAYGAPFAPGYGLGIVAAPGIQGLSYVGRQDGGEDQSTAFSPLLALGVRAGLQSGALTLWTGVDGCWRSAELRLDMAEPIELPRWSVTFSLGAFWHAAGGH
jgi:hypothetical protein